MKTRRGGGGVGDFTVYMLTFKKHFKRLNMNTFLKLLLKKDNMANFYEQLNLCTQVYKQLYAQLMIKRKPSRVISVQDKGT